jgi:class 3 adenylate cyclase
MATGNFRDGARDDTGGRTDLERMLEERARLEERIRREFTQTITVMFTDFKGSTAIAEAEGDMASRLLIKQHHDMLFPILESNRGKLVKTMGDGTLSWFERAQDAVRAAVAFQEALKRFNASRDGKTPIIVRIGLNTGNGIVESDDVFGDAVNVAARFEQLAGPGEVCLSESCYDALDDRDAFDCRFWKMAELKGKSGLHKAFRVHWDPDASAAEEAPEKPARPGAAAPPGLLRSPGPVAARPVPGRGFGSVFRGAVPQRSVPAEQKRRLDAGWIQAEREALAAATNVLDSVVIRRGDTQRLTGESYRVAGDILVEEGGLLVIENARLFFAESAGIVCAGALRAKASTFSAVDTAKGWRNVTIDPHEERVSLFERCTFRFGKGRSLAALPALPGNGSGQPASTYLYGGGLLVRGGSGRSVPVSGCMFQWCSAHEGGGAALLDSAAVLSGCTFEHCSAGITGGGLACLGGTPVLREGAFKECSAGHGGGGASIHASRATLEGCLFDRCSTRHLHGGGLACIESAPTISGCRFAGCSAAREAGGFYRDESSSPRMSNATYAGCTPTDSNG